MRVPTAAAILLCLCGFLRADVLVQEDFEEQGDWSVRTGGGATVELVPEGADGKCLRIRSENVGDGYFTLPLDPDAVRGRSLRIRAMVKTVDVLRGEQVYATAKFHVGGRSGGAAFNRAQWFTGTQDWHVEEWVADVPADAESPVFDLALQNTSGTVYFDSLVIDDGLRPRMAVDLLPLANTSRSDGVADDRRGGFLDAGGQDLRGLPVGDAEFAGIHFRIPDPGENDGAVCIVLRGESRPDLPSEPPAPRATRGDAAEPAAAQVGQKGRRLLFLLAARDVDPARTAPCLVWTVRYADGTQEEIPMREGIDVGAFDRPRDLANWTVVWQDRRPDGPVALGMSTWRNPKPDVVIETVSVRTPGTGAVPVIVGVTLDRTKP